MHTYTHLCTTLTHTTLYTHIRKHTHACTTHTHYIWVVLFLQSSLKLTFPCTVYFIPGINIVLCVVFQEAILYGVLYTKGLYCMVYCIPGGYIVRCVVYQGAVLYGVLYSRRLYCTVIHYTDSYKII